MLLSRGSFLGSSAPDEQPRLERRARQTRRARRPLTCRRRARSGGKEGSEEGGEYRILHGLFHFASKLTIRRTRLTFTPHHNPPTALLQTSQLIPPFVRAVPSPSSSPPTSPEPPPTSKPASHSTASRRSPPHTCSTSRSRPPFNSTPALWTR